MSPPRLAGEALVGSVLAGRYRIVQLLGSGGVGHVYLADSLEGAHRSARVAIKVLRAEHLRSSALRGRFEREAVAALRVSHPNVLRVHEVAVDVGMSPFFAMELLVGLDLADTLAIAARCSPARAVRIAGGLAAALGAAHAAGVVHRDLKPENVFLVHADDGREVVKLIDFGFAWIDGDQQAMRKRPITERLTVVGTPEYMPPEQATGAAAAPSADGYSLGVVLYEMLTGRVPFVGDSYPAIARQHLDVPPPPMRRIHPELAISTELEALVERSLEKDPDRRFPSMTEIGAALARTAEGRAAGLVFSG